MSARKKKQHQHENHNREVEEQSWTVKKKKINWLKNLKHECFSINRMNMWFKVSFSIRWEQSWMKIDALAQKNKSISSADLLLNLMDEDLHSWVWTHLVGSVFMVLTKGTEILIWFPAKQREKYVTDLEIGPTPLDQIITQSKWQWMQISWTKSWADTLFSRGSHTVEDGPGY